MNVQGECIIGAPREVVWSAINRIDLLRLSIPGCLELQEEDDGRLRALVKLKIGVMSAKFRGFVNLKDVCAPHSYTIVGQGDGGVAGFARGSSRVTLAEVGPSITKLSFDADALVGGKLASVGGRLLDATARKLTNQFFENFRVALIAEGSARELEPLHQ
jgi:carbon monoxide dehydrogenase subunit G